MAGKARFQIMVNSSPALQTAARRLAEDAKKLAKEQLAKEAVAVANGEIKRGLLSVASEIREGGKRKPVVTVKREASLRSSFASYSRFSGDTTSIGGKMESEAPDVKKKYDVLASMYFRIVARTPYDEDYAYTVQNPRAEKRQYRYRTDQRTGKRAVVPYAPYVRMHRKDDAVVRDEWRLTLTNDDGTMISFFPKDFSVSFENASNRTAYRSISKTLRERNAGDAGGKNFVSADIRNDSPYVDVLENGRYVKKNSREIHRGGKRFHGVYGGYSVQAPRGMLSVTMAEFRKAEETAEEEQRQVSVEDIGFSMEIPDNAGDAIRDAIEQADGFVNEKDLLASFLKGTATVPMRAKSVSEMRKRYMAAELKRIQAEDEASFRQLQREVEKEGAKERAWETRQSRKKRNHRNALRRLNYKNNAKAEEAEQKALTVKVSTPKSKDETVLVKAPKAKELKDYKEMSETSPVYGTVVYRLEGEDEVLNCKIDKGEVFLTYHSDNTSPRYSSGYQPAEQFLKRMVGRFSEKKFEKALSRFNAEER